MEVKKIMFYGVKREIQALSKTHQQSFSAIVVERNCCLELGTTIIRGLVFLSLLEILKGMWLEFGACRGTK